MQQELDSGRAGSIVAGTPVIDNVANAVVKFEKIEDYTTFLAEYAFINGDVVIHFFPVREAYVQVGDRMRLPHEAAIHWQREFPQVLSPTAEQYFDATRPILTATYVPEMTSWYMRAAGFARRLEPDAFVRRFFERLDAALDLASSAPAT